MSKPPPREGLPLENEITPEMIEVGVAALVGSDSRFASEEDTVRAIYRAMVAASI